MGAKLLDAQTRERVQEIVMKCLENAPSEIQELLGDEFTLVGLALGLIVLGDNGGEECVAMSSTIPNPVASKHVLGARVRVDVANALLAEANDLEKFLHPMGKA